MISRRSFRRLNCTLLYTVQILNSPTAACQQKFCLAVLKSVKTIQIEVRKTKTYKSKIENIIFLVFNTELFLRILCFAPRRKATLPTWASSLASKPLPCKEVIVYPNGKHAGPVLGRYSERLWRLGSCAIYTDYDNDEVKIFNRFKDNTCGKLNYPTGDMIIYCDISNDDN